MFIGVPGLKVALPATAADAKGLMATAIRDDNPVCFFHHYLLTLEPGDVPEGEHLVPFGEAAVRREGDDVTIVATGWMVGKALAAAERLSGEGVRAEVIDPMEEHVLPDEDKIVGAVQQVLGHAPVGR
jgi:pyruvate dehydrogenase E1 component beta subunit